jgi:hypothetical protein
MFQEEWFDPPESESAIARNLKGFLVGKSNPWEGQLLPGIARAMLGYWGYLLGFASRVAFYRESPDKVVVEAKILGVFPFRKAFRG